MFYFKFCFASFAKLSHGGLIWNIDFKQLLTLSQDCSSRAVLQIVATSSINRQTVFFPSLFSVTWDSAKMADIDKYVHHSITTFHTPDLLKLFTPTLKQGLCSDGCPPLPHKVCPYGWLLILFYFFPLLVCAGRFVLSKVSCTVSWSRVSCFSAGKSNMGKKTRPPVRTAGAL